MLLWIVSQAMILGVRWPHFSQRMANVIRRLCMTSLFNYEAILYDAPCYVNLIIPKKFPNLRLNTRHDVDMRPVAPTYREGILFCYQ